MKSEPHLQATMASIEELSLALNGLTAADAARVKQIAVLRAAGTGWDWQDLFNEAVVRCLSGSRKWPLSVPFVAFLVQTMRSIAYEERNEAKLFISSSELDEGSSSTQSSLEDRLVEEVTPERRLRAQQSLALVEALFDGDAQGLAVLLASAEANSPEVICEELGLSKTQYASTLRRIRRKLLAFKENHHD